MAAQKKTPPRDETPGSETPVAEAPVAATPVAEARGDGTPDDTKDRFRQALEAKKGKPGYSGGSGPGGSGQGKGNSSRAGGKREFRRKSG